jgi:hypothetical protein
VSRNSNSPETPALAPGASVNGDEQGFWAAFVLEKKFFGVDRTQSTFILVHLWLNLGFQNTVSDF